MGSLLLIGGDLVFSGGTAVAGYYSLRRAEPVRPAAWAGVVIGVLGVLAEVGRITAAAGT